MDIIRYLCIHKRYVLHNLVSSCYIDMKFTVINKKLLFEYLQVQFSITYSFICQNSKYIYYILVFYIYIYIYIYILYNNYYYY